MISAAKQIYRATPEYKARQKANARAYYLRLRANPERLERRRDYNRAYYQENTERARDYQLTYLANPQKRERRQKYLRTYGMEYRTDPEVRSRLKSHLNLRRARKLGNGKGEPFTLAARMEQIVKQMGECPYCCEDLLVVPTHDDHIIPLSRNGTRCKVTGRLLRPTHSPKNIQITCVPCNLSKRNKTDAEFRAWLLALPI